MNRLVSVIMPNFNGGELIEKSMYSILNSTHREIELIVVDDGSSDNSCEKIGKIAAMDDRVNFVKLPRNGGVANARNCGIEMAKGGLIAFCDSDDHWVPCKLEYQLKEMRSKDALIAHGGIMRKNIVTGRAAPFYPMRRVSIREMYVRNWIVNSVGIYDRDKLGKFYQCSEKHEDYIMWLDLIKVAEFSVAPPELLGFYLLHDKNITRNKLKSVYWHVLAQRKHGLNYLEILKYLVTNVFVRAVGS